MIPWFNEAIFYHLYPLGLCGAPLHNDFSAVSQPRLGQVFAWLEHARDLGASAIYLGPVFESTSHGYDTADYFKVDRRLGDEALLAALVRQAHGLGLRVVLDAVFGHTGRDFWAFKDLQKNGAASPYKDWYRGVDFSRPSVLGDAFNYECWQEAQDLPRLAQNHPAVKDHLLQAVSHWVRAFEIDGLRLDTADCLDLEFLTALRRHCDGLKPDFYLLGEVIHGDYNLWANPNRLHSVTNYEAFKGLWSSHHDRNFFEIAHTLDRQFGATGLYRGLPLYNFADNHDVDRVASCLQGRAQLFSLHCLLFTMPGVPSIYCGSEWGLLAKRSPQDDRMLRPALDLQALRREQPQDLANAIRRLAQLRQRCPALRHGSYRQLCVGAEHLVFEREEAGQRLWVVVNGGNSPLPLRNLPKIAPAQAYTDLLNGDESVDWTQATVPANWARVLRAA
jgi:glycosidase